MCQPLLTQRISDEDNAFAFPQAVAEGQLLPFQKREDSEDTQTVKTHALH